MPGEPPILLPIHNENLPPLLPMDTETKKKQLNLLPSLLSFRDHLHTTRIGNDGWTIASKIHLLQLILNHNNQAELLCACSSSSTSDTQLGKIMPRLFSIGLRLFSIGLTSATACLDIAIQYDVNTFCALISYVGRYYHNAERIVNCADYFSQEHDGKISLKICAKQFQRLIGIGHKTAMIVL